MSLLDRLKLAILGRTAIEIQKESAALSVRMDALEKVMVARSGLLQDAAWALHTATHGGCDWHDDGDFEAARALLARIDRHFTEGC